LRDTNAGMPGLRPYAAIADREAARFLDEAALAIVEAQLACLHRRCADHRGAARDIACQIRDALAARRTLRAACHGQAREVRGTA
jgi:hypothetical protein